MDIQTDCTMPKVIPCGGSLGTTCKKHQQGETDDRKSEVIAFVVNAYMNVTSNNFYIQIQERRFFV